MTAEKKPKFRKATINACIHGDNRKPKPRPVPAIGIGDWEIHRIITGEPWTDPDGEYHDGLGFSWTVTHVPTGFKVWNFDHKRQARHFVEGIPGLKLPKLGNTFGSDTSRNWSESQRNRYHKETARLIKESEGK